MKSKVNSSSTANVDEIEEQSNFEKGDSFEKEFASYMKENLGYETTTTRRNVRSAANATGTNVDVIGFKTDPRGKNLRITGIIYILLALSVIFIKSLYTYDNENNTIESETSTVIFLVALFGVCAGCFAIYKGKTLESENGWVECKNLKTKATINHVTIMFEQFKNYENSNDNKHKFTELYFVSANGFVDNALEFAKQRNVRCFIKDSNEKFVEI
jgi:hypothetical protein